MPTTSRYGNSSQQILPPPLPATTVWSYGSTTGPGTFNYPAFTLEATSGVPVSVTWRNELVDASGNFLPHLLPVDPTLHWANPPGDRLSATVVLLSRRHRGHTPGRCRSSLTYTAWKVSPTRATVMRKRGSCPPQITSPPAMLPRGLGMASSTRRPTAGLRRGRQEPRNSHTPTASAPLPPGTTTIRWA